MASARASLNVDRVSQLLRQVVVDEVLPAFGRLRPDQIEHKQSVGDPDDVVSSVDKAVEARLTPELLALLPGSVVVGEEAAHADPRVLELMNSEGDIWIIDPIDGTRGFVRGDAAFGVMVALVRAQKSCGAWIALPAKGQLFVAELGSGTWLDGQRVTIPPCTHTHSPRGSLYTRYLPEAERNALERAARDQYTSVPGSGSAAIEYTDVIVGNKDFVIYHRLLPWDHVPGTLLVTEAGGSALLPDGTRFTPTQGIGPLIVANELAVSDRVRAWF